VTEKSLRFAQSFSESEVNFMLSLFNGLLRGADVQQLFKSKEAANVIRKFTAMRKKAEDSKA
jgi:hypothetical protein